MRARRAATPGSAASLAGVSRREKLGELAHDRRGERIAVNGLDRRADRLDVRLGQRSPAAADRIEDRPARRGLEAVAQDVVDAALGEGVTLGEQRLDRQRAERQADPMVSDMVVRGLRDLEAAAAHVADKPHGAEKSRDHAERRVTRLFFPGEDANLEPALGGDCGRKRRPIGGAAHRLGRGRVDPFDAHRIGDGAEPAHRLDGSPEAFGRDGARLSQPLAEPEKRLFVEARHRRTAELVIDQEPNRIRSDVDDRIMRARAHDALGIEVEPPHCGVVGSGCPGHRALPAGADHA